MGIYSIFQVNLVGTYGRLFLSMKTDSYSSQSSLGVWQGASHMGFGFSMADWDGDLRSLAQELQ